MDGPDRTASQPFTTTSAAPSGLPTAPDGERVTVLLEQIAFGRLVTAGNTLAAGISLLKPGRTQDLLLETLAALDDITHSLRQLLVILYQRPQDHTVEALPGLHPIVATVVPGQPEGVRGAEAASRVATAAQRITQIAERRRALEQRDPAGSMGAAPARAAAELAAARAHEAITRARTALDRAAEVHDRASQVLHLGRNPVRAEAHQVAAIADRHAADELASPPSPALADATEPA